jgi:hypothetical protein
MGYSLFKCRHPAGQHIVRAGFMDTLNSVNQIDNELILIGVGRENHIGGNPPGMHADTTLKKDFGFMSPPFRSEFIVVVKKTLRF